MRTDPRGFTLLEVLVAVAIVAIVALVVGIGMSGMGGARQLQREAERLQTHLRYACELATLDGRPVGLRQSNEGYAFVQHDVDQWRLVQQQEVLAPYRLPPGSTLVLYRDGRTLHPVIEDVAERAPQLVCFASGELTPFSAELTLAGVDQRYRIEGHADGTLELSHVDIAH